MSQDEISRTNTPPEDIEALEVTQRESTPGGTRTVKEYYDDLADTISFTASDQEDLSRDPGEVFLAQVEEFYKEISQEQRDLRVVEQQPQMHDILHLTTIRPESPPTAPMYGAASQTSRYENRTQGTLISTPPPLRRQLASVPPTSSDHIDPYEQLGMREVFSSAMNTPLTRQYQPIAPPTSPYRDRSPIQSLNPSRSGTGPYTSAYRTGQPASRSYTSPQAGPVSGSMNLSSAPAPNSSTLRRKRKAQEEESGHTQGPPRRARKQRQRTKVNVPPHEPQKSPEAEVPSQV